MLKVKRGNWNHTTIVQYCKAGMVDLSLLATNPQVAGLPSTCTWKVEEKDRDPLLDRSAPWPWALFMSSTCLTITLGVKSWDAENHKLSTHYEILNGPVWSIHFSGGFPIAYPSPSSVHFLDSFRFSITTASGSTAASEWLATEKAEGGVKRGDAKWFVQRGLCPIGTVLASKMGIVTTNWGINSANWGFQ